MIDPIITQLCVVDRPTPYQSSGDRLIAHFTAKFAGMTVRGLRLVKTVGGGFRVISPAVSRDDGSAAIRFTDNQTHHRLMDAARKLYMQMGGQFGDYAGQMVETSGDASD